jgi:hypothetical protein
MDLLVHPNLQGRPKPQDLRILDGAMGRRMERLRVVVVVEGGEDELLGGEGGEVRRNLDLESGLHLRHVDRMIE